jgi:hypothetical protein
MKYINKTEKLLVVKIDQYRLIIDLRRGYPINQNGNYLNTGEGTWPNVMEHTDFFISTFLPTGEKLITCNPDLQFVWHAFDDKSKMAYLPSARVRQYDHNNIPNEKYLRRYGKMLSYNKFVEKFHTQHFPKGYNITLEVRDDVTNIYNQHENVGSCMSDKNYLTDMYEEVGCNILTAWNDGEVYGRAIVWNNHELVQGEKNYPALLDRCYAVSNDVKDLMRDYAVKHGWDIRQSDCSYYDEFVSGNKYRIAIRPNYIPWLDTFRQGVLIDEKPYATNDAYKRGKTLQNTDGTELQPLYCDCCGELIEEEKVLYIGGDSFCRNCAVLTENEGWILREDAQMDVDENWFRAGDENYYLINGEWYYCQDRRIVWDTYTQEYILKSEAVFSPDGDGYTHRDNVKECKECGELVYEVNEEGLCTNCIEVEVKVNKTTV